MKRNKQHCPNCKRSLRGAPIPKKDQKFFKGAKYYLLSHSIYDRTLDITVKYMCPFCFYSWER